MSGESYGACLGHHLGQWGMSGAFLGHHLGHVWASSGAYLGNVWSISGASSEGMFLGQSKISAVLHASLMPIFDC